MNRAAVAAIFAMLSLAACSSTPQPAEAPAPAGTASLPPVTDHSALFPAEDKTGTVIVPNHMLDMKALPGGSLAEYDANGTKFQEFIIDTDSPQKAAFMMLDMKAEMKDPQYLASMGGYVGTYEDKPLYCFAKLHYLAGVVGLPQAQADPQARTLAAQLK